jgi:7-cyano-7-deazaguanine synthase
MTKKVIAIISGGMDSTLSAFIMKNRGFEVIPMHFSYGQKTEKKELKSFNKIAKKLNNKKYILDIKNMFLEIGKGTTSLIDQNIEVPTDGIHVDTKTSEIPNSYVPYRNGIFLSIATAIAEKEKANGIVIGVVEEDSSGYPDCRENFMQSFENTINLGTKDDTKLQIFRPLVNLKKSEIVKKALDLDVPLNDTWSCYQNSEKACGVCDSCRLRLKGFREAGVKDQILYV